MSPQGFALNRYFFQTLKEADEMGGVCYLEYGDNQHDQPSMVSVYPRCHICKILAVAELEPGLSTETLHVRGCKFAVRFRKKCIGNNTTRVCL